MARGGFSLAAAKRDVLRYSARLEQGEVAAIPEAMELADELQGRVQNYYDLRKRIEIGNLVIKIWSRMININNDNAVMINAEIKIFIGFNFKMECGRKYSSEMLRIICRIIWDQKMEKEIARRAEWIKANHLHA